MMGSWTGRSKRRVRKRIRCEDMKTALKQAEMRKRGGAARGGDDVEGPNRERQQVRPASDSRRDEYAG